MTSKEKQMKNMFIYLLPILVGNVLPLITLPIFTRILSTEDYGVWALAQVYAMFMVGLANFGLTTGYERNFFEHRDSERAGKLLHSTLAFVTATSFFFGIMTFLFKKNLARWVIGSDIHADMLFWTYCSNAVISLKLYFLIFFKNSENAKSYAWFIIDESLLGVVFSLFMVVYLRIGVIGLVWGQLFASGIVLAVVFLRFLRTYPLAFDWGILKESLKISLPLTPRVFLGTIGSQFDKYLIGLLGSIGGVGIYNIGQKVAYGVFTYMTAIQNVYFPQVYKKMFDSGENGGKEIGRYLTPFLYISIAIALAVAVFAEEIIMILTPSSYHGAIEIVMLLSLLFGTYFFGKQPQLTYAKKTSISSMLSFLSIFLNVAINIPFIQMWGAIGAAWGTLVAGLISGIAAFVASQHYYRIHWEYLKIIPIFLIFFCSTLLLILLKHLQVPYEMRLIVKLLATALYIYLGMILNVVRRENYEAVKMMIFSSRAKSNVSRQGELQQKP